MLRRYLPSKVTIGLNYIGSTRQSFTPPVKPSVSGTSPAESVYPVPHPHATCRCPAVQRTVNWPGFRFVNCTSAAPAPSLSWRCCRYDLGSPSVGKEGYSITSADFANECLEKAHEELTKALSSERKLSGFTVGRGYTIARRRISARSA